MPSMFQGGTPSAASKDYVDAQIAAAISTNQIGQWGKDNIAIDQTAVDLPLVGDATRSTIPMVRRGSVIGIAISSNAPISAGTITATVVVDGTPVAVSAQLSSTSAQTVVAEVAAETVTFNAGSVIGVNITTNHTFAPVTADVTATVLTQELQALPVA